MDFADKLINIPKEINISQPTNVAIDIFIPNSYAIIVNIMMGALKTTDDNRYSKPFFAMKYAAADSVIATIIVKAIVPKDPGAAMKTELIRIEIMPPAIVVFFSSLF
ncbi:MAG: hypothetical protein ABIH42_02360 [Planctomycetota bacterium]